MTVEITCTSTGYTR